MKTKIVYVVTSLDDDIYMEQAIVSAWSVRYYNQNAHIVLVCCQDTFATLQRGNRKNYVTLFDEIVVKNFLPEQGMLERSRWLKTTLRDIIEGDFLFLDTDTVVCADLSYVDDFKFDLGFVLDSNCQFDKSLFKDWVVPAMKQLFDIDVSKETQYFNSGVCVVRDTEKTRSFYHRWNELWIYSAQKFHRMKDQQPLMKANIDMGYVITELSGDLNCQVEASIQYLHTAHVMHFFNCFLGRSSDLTPFIEAIYLQVKQYGLTDPIKNNILHCKSSFCSPSMPVLLNDAMILRRIWRPERVEEKIKSSNSYYAILFIWQRFPRLMHFIEKFFGALIRLSQLRK